MMVIEFAGISYVVISVTSMNKIKKNSNIFFFLNRKFKAIIVLVTGFN